MKTGDFVVYIVTLMALKAAESGTKRKLHDGAALRVFFTPSSSSSLNKSLSFMAIMSRRHTKLLRGGRIEIQ